VGVLGLFRPTEICLAAVDAGRVRLLDGQATVWELPAGAALEIRRSGRAVRIAMAGRRPVAGNRFEQIPAVPGGRTEIRLPNGFRRVFRGPLAVHPSAGGWLQVVVSRPLEDYVMGVVAAELRESAPPAAMQALAVAARTQALRWRGRHADEGYDLCDTTHCMLYQGEESGAAAIRPALAAAAPDVLVRDGAPAPAPFTACCGGAPLPAAWIWPGAAETVPARACDRCQGSPDAAWTAEVAAEDFLERIGTALKIPRPSGIRVEEPRGTAPVLVLATATGDRRFPVEEFRIACGRTFGWNLIRSNRFEVRQEGDRLAFAGRGYGHNAGMCLAGAVAMARAGAAADAILEFYYPDCRRVSRFSTASSQSGW
jgi:stage II sporulation protein D